LKERVANESGVLAGGVVQGDGTQAVTFIYMWVQDAKSKKDY